MAASDASLVGILAAAGLAASAPLVEPDDTDVEAPISFDIAMTDDQSGASTIVEGNDHRSAIGGESDMALVSDEDAGLPDNAGQYVADLGGDKAIQAPANDDAVSDSDAGTDVPAAASPVAAMVADAMPMLSPGALAALVASARGVGRDDVDASGDTAVGAVLADALAGSDTAGPDIDALLQYLPRNETADAARAPANDTGEWLGGHSAGGSGLPMLHADFAMLHMDAVQPIANG